MEKRRIFELPTNWRQAYPSEFLKPIDLTRDGKWVTATVEVSRVVYTEVKNVKGRMDKTLLIHFTGKKKALLANVTICKQMQAVSGTENPHGWTGVTVELYVDDKVKNPQDGGKLTATAVRVRTPKAGAVVSVSPDEEVEAPPLPEFSGPPEEEYSEDDVDEHGELVEEPDESDEAAEAEAMKAEAAGEEVDWLEPLAKDYKASEEAKTASASAGKAKEQKTA